MKNYKSFDLSQKEKLNLSKAVRIIQETVEKQAKPNRKFVLNEKRVLSIHAICMEGILDRPGAYRQTQVSVGRLKPPAPEQVSLFMAKFIEQVNRLWEDENLFKIGAYALWGLNWVHPFLDGNGRTSRLLSYFLMNMRAGYLFPGKESFLVPEQLGGQKRPIYVEALRLADQGNLEPMTELLKKLLAVQLQSVT